MTGTEGEYMALDGLEGEPAGPFENLPEGLLSLIGSFLPMRDKIRWPMRPLT